LLKELAPGVNRVAVIRDPLVPAGSAGFAAIQTVAPSFGVELTPIGVHDAGEIERDIAAFARAGNGGLITVGPPSSMMVHRNLVITLAARHRLPAVYPTRVFVNTGGLMSYGAHHQPVRRHGCGMVACSTGAGVDDDGNDQSSDSGLAANRSGARQIGRRAASESSIERGPN